MPATNTPTGTHFYTIGHVPIFTPKHRRRYKGRAVRLHLILNRRIFYLHRYCGRGGSSCRMEVSHKRAVLRDQTFGNSVGRRKALTEGGYTANVWSGR